MPVIVAPRRFAGRVAGIPTTRLSREPPGARHSSIGRREPAGERVLLARRGSSRAASTARSAPRAPCPNRGFGRGAGSPERRERPERRLPARTRPARRRRAPGSSAASSRTRYGAQLSRSDGRGLLSGRRAFDRRRTHRSIASGRRRAARSPAGSRARAAWSAGHRKSPLASPVNTRPVRLPPCAAGASPSNRMRAFGSPNPGTGRPQYSSSAEACDLLQRDPLAPLDQPRAAPAVDDLALDRLERAVVPRRCPWPSIAGYFRSSLSRRRDTIESPRNPIRPGTRRG